MSNLPDRIENEVDASVLLLVPGGTFHAGPMGSGGFPVDLPPFYLAIHPVTNAQYKCFVDATGHRPPDETDWGEPIWEGDRFTPTREDHPVVCVSWHDAKAYCDWTGVCLPSELEWEKASRGTDDRIFPWGGGWGEVNKCRNSRNHGIGQTSDVMSYPEGCSPWGHSQMLGNVWEWCEDWYDADAYHDYKRGNLTAPTRGLGRVKRGGSWADPPNDFSCATQNYEKPDERSFNTGFRVARSVD